MPTLTEYREQLGCSMEAFAREAGLSPQVIKPRHAWFTNPGSEDDR